MTSGEEAAAAIRACDGMNLNNRTLRVNEARPKEGAVAAAGTTGAEGAVGIEFSPGSQAALKPDALPGGAPAQLG